MQEREAKKARDAADKERRAQERKEALEERKRYGRGANSSTCTVLSNVV